MMEDMDDFERIVAHNYTMTEVEQIQWGVDGHHLSRMLEHSPPRRGRILPRDHSGLLLDRGGTLVDPVFLPTGRDSPHALRFYQEDRNPTGPLGVGVV